MMCEHKLFYFPYSSLDNSQLSLLKIAALYFDKLVILDPVGASWGGIGADHVTRDAVVQLQQAGILELVTPAETLAKYSEQIFAAVRRDMQDQEFLALCEAQSQYTGKRSWTLSLAKVPEDLPADNFMRKLLGDFAREVSGTAGHYVERNGGDPTEFLNCAHGHAISDRYTEGYTSGVEYRFAEFPLALGESIMMNHALFSGLLYADATPLTEYPFHSRMLAHKLQRAVQEPAVKAARDGVIRERQIKSDRLAATTMLHSNVSLPVLSPAIRLEDVLEYRQKNNDSLIQARRALGLVAQQIKMEPWSDDFAQYIECDAIPKVIQSLQDTKKARTSWLESSQGRLAVKGMTIVTATASAILTYVTSPVTALAGASAALGVASGTIFPGIDWLLDRKAVSGMPHENELHYLMSIGPDE